MERIGEGDHASDFDGTSIDEYAEHRGFQLANPTRKARKTTMAGAGPGKAELQETIDAAMSALDAAYAPEPAREDLATAVGQALDIAPMADGDGSVSVQSSSPSSVSSRTRRCHLFRRAAGDRRSGG